MQRDKEMTGSDDVYAEALLVWAAETSKLARLIAEIGEVLQALSQKRVTLEEKMIRRYLHEFASVSGLVIGEIHGLLKEQPAKLDGRLFASLNELTDETALALKDLGKIINYDLNFLEQYFEHGFYTRIENDSRLLSRLEAIARELQSKRAPRPCQSHE